MPRNVDIIHLFLILKIALRSRFYYHFTEQTIEDQVHELIRIFGFPKLTFTVHLEGEHRVRSTEVGEDE